MSRRERVDELPGGRDLWSMPEEPPDPADVADAMRSESEEPDEELVHEPYRVAGDSCVRRFRDLAAGRTTLGAMKGYQLRQLAVWMEVAAPGDGGLVLIDTGEHLGRWGEQETPESLRALREAIRLAMRRIGGVSELDVQTLRSIPPGLRRYHKNGGYCSLWSACDRAHTMLVRRCVTCNGVGLTPMGRGQLRCPDCEGTGRAP